MRAFRATVMTVLAAAMLAACDLAFGPSGELTYPTVPPAGTNAVPAELAAAYDESAAILALRLLQQTNSPALRSVLLPAELVASIRNALDRVYAFEHAARDTIIETHAIRAFPAPTVLEVLLGVAASTPWLEPLAAGEPTGNARIDELFAQYELFVVRHYAPWTPGGTHMVTLRGPGPLNTEALARQFLGLPGLLWAEPNGYAGDGSDIQLERRRDGWILHYSYGFGDCPAGCTGRVAWSFRVGADGGVSYIGRSERGVAP